MSAGMHGFKRSVIDDATDECYWYKRLLVYIHVKKDILSI